MTVVSANRALINAWLEEGMRRAPSHPALVFNGEAWSHAELDARSNQVARYLSARGIGHGDRVGLCLDRSFEMVVVLIGILKAGAAYVPLDPAYPSERIAMMMEDAKLGGLISHQSHAERFRQRMVWEEIVAEIDEQPTDVMTGAELDPESSAYVIFTSGSTGRPKGIDMPHRALSNLIEWQLSRTSFKPSARVLQYSSISFDVSFQEIATTIASAGTLHLITNEERKDARKLLEHLIDQRIERLFLPYVALRSLVEAAHAANRYPLELKEVVTAGEQLRVDGAVREFFRQIEGAALDNQYGPSETHVVTAHLLEGNPDQWPDLPSIGKVLPNCATYILNDAMQPVDQGRPGQLFLAGRHLAKGYIGRDDLTAKAFIENPFNDSEWRVLYNTGDLVSCNEDQTIEFLGRADQQIKVRGYRVEPGEINNAMAAYPGIGQSVTHARRTENDVVQLATYFTVQEGSDVDALELRRHLSSKLPEYMVPAFLVEMDAIPYTPSGKVDLKALPAPSIANSRYALEEAAYATDTEAALAGIWSGLLGMEEIPSSADFFELGGDSLRAVSLFLAIARRFGKELPLTTLAHAPTISQLADAIDGRGQAADLSGFRSLQMIKQGAADAVPLFMVHGGMGNTLVYHTLADHLDADQPLYGLQWPGWDGKPCADSLEALAEGYRDELLRFHSGGPVRLGGYCIGGLLAIELAEKLRAAGIEVLDPLFILDAPNLHASTHCNKEPWDSASLLREYETLKERLLSQTESFSPTQTIFGNPEKQSKGVAGMLKRLPGLHGLVRLTKEVRALQPVVRARLQGRPVAMEHRGDHCLRRMIRAVKAYRPKAHPGDMVYFRSHSAIGRTMGLAGWWRDPFMGFGELCNGAFTTHVVGGTHRDMVEVPEIGSIVSSVIKQGDIK